MGVNLDNLPALEDWVNITEAAEIIGISRQYAYRMAARTNDGLEGGWQTIHRIGTKGNYLISLNEVHERKRIKEAGGNVAGLIDLDEEEPTVFEPSPRLVSIFSWWVAAELVRRHPHLIILETHPGGGMYDCLSIRDGRDAKNTPPIVDLNRAGQIHIYNPLSHMLSLTWSDCLSATYPHYVVDRIEDAAGLSRISNQPSTGRTLAYEFIASTLALTIHSPHRWDARNEFLDSSGDDTGWKPDDDLRGYIQNFPSLIRPANGERETPLDQTPRVGIWREPYSHYWAIIKYDDHQNEQPLLMVSIEGRIDTDEGSIELTDQLVKLTGGMHALAAALLKDHL